jgi:hypothetical protein
MAAGLDYTNASSFASTNTLRVVGRSDERGKRIYHGFSAYVETGSAVASIYHGSSNSNSKIQTIAVTGKANQEVILEKGIGAEAGLFVECDEGTFDFLNIYWV